jgi:PST family polysaccharide transporter
VRDDRAQLQAYFEGPAKQVIVWLFPLYTALILFAEDIIRIGFGPMWLPAVPLMIAFGFAGFVRSLCAPFPQLVKGLGKPQYWLWWALVFSALLCFSLLLFLWFSPDVVSAAWSRTAVKYLFELFLLGWLARLCNVDMRPVMLFAGKMMFLLIPFALLTLTAGVLVNHPVVALVLKTAIFTTGFLSILWYFHRRPPNE